MGSIGSLYVSINANDDNLRKGMKKTEESLLSFKNIVKTLAIAEVFNLATDAVKSLGRELGASMKEAADHITRVARLSDILNISTERLIGWGKAADDAGMDTQAFEAALVKLFKNLGGAEEESGATFDALNKIGLKLSDLEGLSSAEIFYKISDAIKNTGSSAAQLNATLALFGKSGAPLLTVAKDGADAWREAEKAVAATGQAISRLDAAKVEEARLAVKALGDMWDSIAVNLVVVVSPIITMLAKQFAAMGNDGTTWGVKVKTSIKESALGIASMLDVLYIYMSAWKVIVTLKEAAVLAVSRLVQLTATLAKMSPLALASQSYTDILTVIEKIAKEFADTTETAMQNSAKAAKEYADNFVKFISGGAGAAETAFNKMLDAVDKKLADRIKKLEELGNKAALVAKKIMSGAKEMSNMVNPDSLDDVEMSKMVKPKAGPEQFFRFIAMQKLAERGTFRQMSLNNMSLAGVSTQSQEQKVNDPQLKDTNAILKKIAMQLSDPSIPLAG